MAGKIDTQKLLNVVMDLHKDCAAPFRGNNFMECPSCKLHLHETEYGLVKHWKDDYNWNFITDDSDPRLLSISDSELPGIKFWLVMVNYTSAGGWKTVTYVIPGIEDENEAKRMAIHQFKMDHNNHPNVHVELCSMLTIKDGTCRQIAFRGG